MKENIIDEMYMLAVKNKLQRGAISLEEKVNYIVLELKSIGTGDSIPVGNIGVQIPNIDTSTATDVNNKVTETSSTLAASTSISTPKVELEVKYAQNPDDAGFNNRDMEFSPDSCFYKIEISKGTPEAKFCLLTEDRVVEEYKLSPGIAPENVVVFENNSSEGTQLRVVAKGLLEKRGRYWEIIEPCRMKWI